METRRTRGSTRWGPLLALAIFVGIMAVFYLWPQGA